MGPLRLATRIASLDERVDGDRGEHSHRNGCRNREGEHAPMSPSRRNSFRLELPLGLMPRPPGEHGVSKDIVEDFVTRPGRAVLPGADDPFLDKPM